MHGGTTDLLLVGGGHAHVLVLRDLALKPEPGLRVTLLARDLAAPYSGMLPGLVAGLYREEDIHIDLPRLCRAAGARLVHGAAVGMDLDRRQVSVAGGDALGYDMASIDVGITPAIADIPGAADHAVAVKPISTFWRRWSELSARAGTLEPRSVAVVGGGAAGFELVLALAARLGRPAGPGAAGSSFTLVAGDGLLPGFPARARRLATSALRAAGVRLVEGDPTRSVEEDGLILASARRIDADFVLLATRAKAPDWLRETGLALDDRAFLATRQTLQSVGRDEVFAVGDCATILGSPRPKAGVFAVRQGPVLAENIRRLKNGRPLRLHRPQRRFLTLLSTSDGSAIASKGPFAAAGPWAFRWKDRIDRSFMRLFADLPAGP